MWEITKFFSNSQDYGKCKVLTNSWPKIKNIKNSHSKYKFGNALKNAVVTIKKWGKTNQNAQNFVALRRNLVKNDTACTSKNTSKNYLKIQYHKLFVFSILVRLKYWFRNICSPISFLFGVSINIFGGWVVVFEPSSLEDERVNNGFEYCILVRRPAPCHAYRVIWLFCRAKERCELWKHR